MDSRSKILVVDDEEPMRHFLSEALRRRGFKVEVAEDAPSALALLEAGRFNIILMDVKLPGMSGIEATGKILTQDPKAVVIAITAHGSHATALEALRQGAYDYFTKPFRLAELEVVISRALEKQSLLEEIERLRRQLAGQPLGGRIVGKSGCMEALFETLAKVVETDATVLIEGESGTGKELIAHALHEGSPRRSRPFVKLNCVAIPEGLLESELFGHERGAFTGALITKKGKFELADGGTIFLDEIGDMSPSTQAKTLRVLQEREFERVGGTKTIRADVRIIAATNQNLPRLIEEGRFREDLYYRLDVVSLRVPPLRERRDDITLLAEYFLAGANAQFGRHVKGFTSEVMATFLSYSWPGNVRELRNIVERMVLTASGDVLGPDLLPPHIKGGPAPLFEAVPLGQGLDAALERLERDLIVSSLRRCGGIQSKAARELGISERSLWYRVKKLRISPAQLA